MTLIETASLTEKATLLSEKQNKYVFRVRPRANKIQIKQAIEKLFQKKVADVNTCNYAGKKKRERRAEFRPQIALEKGDRDVAGRGEDRTRMLHCAMALEILPPTYSDAAVQIAARLSMKLRKHGRRRVCLSQEENGRPESFRPADLAPHRRRSQTPISEGRFQKAKARN